MRFVSNVAPSVLNGYRKILCFSGVPEDHPRAFVAVVKPVIASIQVCNVVLQDGTPQKTKAINSFHQFSEDKKMARGINKVILIGHLGADPDIRYMPSGEPVANLSLATSESWKDGNTGETREKTEWHRVVAFRKLAEIIGQYCKKGSKLYIEGRLQTRKWQDQNGQDRYTTEIICDQMQMLDSKPGNAPPPYGESEPGGSGLHQNTGGAQSSAYAAESGASAGKRKSAKATTPLTPNEGNDFDDDEIPF